ncbi:MAG TPA: (E)-4-hydroxy-3-methylbut-2-enyl-diphosphate synthase [Bacteroidales bacterium]|nr:(E)-4-hydroxy-3-methylbut-2-enyl-diphosphate synthase [Bacteroidales bacterium]
MSTSSYCQSLYQYNRRNSTEVQVGTVAIGGQNPIRLQSMTNTITRKIDDTVEQCIKIYEAGGELVRITTPTLADVDYVAGIKKELRKRGYTFPLVTDVHFSPNVAEAAASIVEKVRINPGNYSESKFDIAQAHNEVEWQKHFAALTEKFLRLLAICKEHGTALRIGVNHGSLSQRMMSRYGDTPEGMTESAMEFLRICKEEAFHDVVISMKASNVQVMVQAYRMLIASMMKEDMNFPLHLGVTEAGEGEDGRIKSAVGIGALLADGIGDTVRVSLTEDPELEIPVANKLVSYFEGREKVTAFADFPHNLDLNPFQYSRRKTSGTSNPGSSFPPVVIGSIYREENPVSDLQPWGWNLETAGIFKFNDQAADYIFAGMLPEGMPQTENRGFVVPFYQWHLGKSKTNSFPLLSLEELLDFNPDASKVFVKATYKDLTQFTDIVLPENVILVLDSTSKNAVAEWRACFSYLKSKNINSPVILYKNYAETNAEDLQIKAACDFGALLIDGLGDGIWIENKSAVTSGEINSIAFGILQATRTRISKTEYISCPSCGRTLFDLQTTSARIRERTKHLKGLKIGIMGCIVNGPGEMADADYGYVGAGPGRITLYKSREVIRKNIAEEEAVEELINLIKANGDWLEPV